MLSMMSSRREVAWASVMSLRFRDAVGGRYTFTTFILRLFGRMTFVCRQYSFPAECSICSGFRTYVASPPLVLSARRYSITV